jgi:hypothetical protein
MQHTKVQFEAHLDCSRLQSLHPLVLKHPKLDRAEWDFSKKNFSVAPRCAVVPCWSAHFFPSHSQISLYHILFCWFEPTENLGWRGWLIHWSIVQLKTITGNTPLLLYCVVWHTDGARAAAERVLCGVAVVRLGEDAAPARHDECWGDEEPCTPVRGHHVGVSTALASLDVSNPNPNALPHR